MQGSNVKESIAKLSSGEEIEVEYGLRNLINQAVQARNQVEIRNCGGIEKLVPLMGSENQVLQMLAAWALSNLSNEDKSRFVILKAGVVNQLIPILSNSTNPDVLAKSLWLLTNLANQEQNRKFLAACGVPKLMANLLRFPVESVVLESTKPLRNLVIELECQKSFALAGGVLNLIGLLTSTNTEIIIEVLQVLYNLTVATDVMRKLVVSAGSLPPLMFNLSSRNEEIVEYSLKVLITLSLAEENELKILNAGVILPTVDLFHSPNLSIQEQSALLLSNLSCNETIRENLRYCGLVTPLVDRLNSSHVQLQEQAARLITNLAMDDFNRIELQDAGAKARLEKLLANTNNQKLKEAANLAINNLSVSVSDSVRDTIAEKFTGTLRPSKSLRQLELRRQASILRPQLLRRDRIAKELLDTEKSYVESLNVVIRVFLNPIMDSIVKDSTPIITDEEVKTIFSIIEIIAKVNGDFSKELETRMSKWDSSMTLIGDILLNFTDKMKVYTRYINNYDNTMKAYGICLKNSPLFSGLMDKARALPETKGLDLLSFLIMPVQRIPRYILLFNDLLKNTPTDHADYSKTEMALEKTRGIAGFLNEAKRNAENASRVVVIQDSLIGLDEELVKDGRLFVREGSLIKKKNKASEYCYVFLFTDILLHAQEKKQHYRIKDKIQLSQISVQDIPDTDLLKNSFKLNWGKDRSWILSANSGEDKKGWVADLQKHIASNKQ